VVCKLLMESAGEGKAAREIAIRVNGDPRRCAAGLRLDQLLLELGYRPQLVVVEYNGEILPRARWSGQEVQESDVLEVVTIVGGGS
jgi:sulfur carrier protein